MYLVKPEEYPGLVFLCGSAGLCNYSNENGKVWEQSATVSGGRVGGLSLGQCHFWARS